MRSIPRPWIPALLLLASVLAGPTALAADPAAASTPAPESGPPRVKVTTSMGEFTIELMPDRAPLTVPNFLRYVKEGFYSGTLIHRVIANFVIQGGGYDAGDSKLKPTHEPIVNESGNGLQNKRGTVGLARGEPAHSGNAQLYVNLVDNPDLDPLPTRWGYTVFGKVIEGMEVIDRIGVTATGASGAFKSDAPIKPVIIERVVLLDGSAATAAPMPLPTANPSNMTILSPK
jgi:cyclophilin family peptidyl-prolyl cis-trans isomerase